MYKQLMTWVGEILHKRANECKEFTVESCSYDAGQEENTEQQKAQRLSPDQSPAWVEDVTGTHYK